MALISSRPGIAYPRRTALGVISRGWGMRRVTPERVAALEPYGQVLSAGVPLSATPGFPACDPPLTAPPGNRRRPNCRDTASVLRQAFAYRATRLAVPRRPAPLSRPSVSA